jgi:hypothetical protein
MVRRRSSVRFRQRAPRGKHRSRCLPSTEVPESGNRYRDFCFSGVEPAPRTEIKFRLLEVPSSSLRCIPAEVDLSRSGLDKDARYALAYARASLEVFFYVDASP